MAFPPSNVPTSEGGSRIKRIDWWRSPAPINPNAVGPRSPYMAARESNITLGSYAEVIAALHVADKRNQTERTRKAVVVGAFDASLCDVFDAAGSFDVVACVES